MNSTLRSFRNSLFFIALLFILLGILSIAYAIVATSFATSLMGAILIVSGVFYLASCIHMHKWRGFGINILFAIVNIVIGIWFLIQPLQVAIALTLLIAIFFFISGIFRVLQAIYLHGYSGWLAYLFSGALSIVLGLLIAQQWPSSGLWVIGLFIGVDLLIAGWAMLVLAINLRQFEA